MELYACGFNAWNQLRFQTTEEPEIEPDDYREFKCVLKTDEDITSVRAGLSWTLVKTTASLFEAGSPDPLADELKRRFEDGTDKESYIAVARNGTVVAAVGNKLNEYASWTAYPSAPSRSLGIMPISNLVAGACTFFALTESENPEAVSWGDERYSACLARDGDEGASTPRFVADLADLPSGNVTEIHAGGGYIFAAMMTGKDAYVWGIGEGLSGSPEPLDLDGQDILDIAVGDNHMLALTTDGRVWMWGKGPNGQLGMGDRKEVKGWEVIPVTMPSDRKIVSVAAGEKSSFLIVKLETA